MLMNQPAHINLLKTPHNINLQKDIKISVYTIDTKEAVNHISTWATHFKEQYCEDSQIEALIKGTSLSRKEYLLTYKFPSATESPGPSIRSGDFAEILVSDYLEFLMGYWIPRQKYQDKAVRNESVKGVDIIGFKLEDENNPISSDELIFFEVKAGLTKGNGNRLQDAINDSGKDLLRHAETLNATKQRLLNRDDNQAALKISRFQNIEDNPFTQKWGAAAVISPLDNNLSSLSLNLDKHHDGKNLVLVLIQGDDLMSLVNELYQRAADEA
ncbi:MAG: DUF1837 domain-containing protein [Proteobacteria bacterium]|nr:DUF1837 domain-containing protein [Pseudomonadota bacterium]